MTTPSVPKSTSPPKPSLGEEIITEVEHVFEPKPGGIIDTWRKDEQRRQAAALAAEYRGEPVEERSSHAVKVTPLAPETYSAVTHVIGPQAKMMILPRNDFRYRATILVTTAASSVILAKDVSSALSSSGFTLPDSVPLPLLGRAQLYAYNPGNAAVQVSVISEIYAGDR